MWPQFSLQFHVNILSFLLLAYVLPFSVFLSKSRRSLSLPSHTGGRQYTWTRLPQGYIDSPAVFSAVVRDALCDLVLPTCSVVLQYADDLLVSAVSEKLCEQAFLRLLHHLASKGFKVSKPKLQFCLPTVKYLGFELSQGSKKLSQDRIQVILNTRRPDTKHALMAFLGLINYCRQWISDCSYYDKCLRSAISHKDPMQRLLTWTPEMLEVYEALRMALERVPSLCLQA
ncbi:MAG: reverse transcriptase domain-containing protein [Cetobacterium sp.]